MPSIDLNSVGVVIPFFNGSRWIERALQSVLNQTITANELIVVNDGSTKEETNFIEKLQKKYSFQLINKKNGGQGSARNVGAKLLESKFIAFLDQDDSFLPHHIEDLLAITPSNDLRLGWVYGDIARSDIEGLIIDSHLLRHKKHGGIHPKSGFIIDLIKTDFFVLPSASLILKSAFDYVDGFDPQFIGYEDDDLFFRLYRAGYTNYFTEKIVAIWSINLESATYSLSFSESRLNYFKKLNNSLKDQPRTGLFFMKDALCSRFWGDFRNDLQHAISTNHIDTRNYADLTRSALDLITQNNYVSLDQKNKCIREYKSLIKMNISIDEYGEAQKLLQKYYQSNSWRMTKLLRTVEAAISKERYRETDAGIIPADDEHAKRLITEILASPSWKMTRAPRALKDIFYR